MTEPIVTSRRARLSRAVAWPRSILSTLLRAVPAAIEDYFAQRLPQHAAGIAYRVLFSLGPLAIVLVSIFGLVLQDDELRAEVIDRIVGWLPVSVKGSDAVEEAVTSLASTSSLLGLLSLAVFVWASTGMMGALRTGLETALQVERHRRRPAARAKFVDLVLVAGAGLLVIALIAITFVTQVIARLVDGVAQEIGIDGGVAGELIRFGVPLLLSTVVVTLLYRFVPARRLGFGDTLAGGVVTGLLLVAISAASAYVFDQATSLSAIYGSVTVVFVFLYSVYLYASALLFGATVAAAWSRPPAARPAEPFAAQLKRAVLGLFVRVRPPPSSPTPRGPGSGSQPSDDTRDSA